MKSEIRNPGSGIQASWILEVLQKILMPIASLCITALDPKAKIYEEKPKRKGRGLPGDEHFYGALTG